MQTIQLDIFQKTEMETILAKQDDVGRKFQAQILENGKPYKIPHKATISLWYSGAAGEGNYTDINGDNPFVVYEDTVTVEMISQMLRAPGSGQMCLVMLNEDGSQIGLWNIPYTVEKIPGMESPGAKDYFNALTKMLQDISVDPTLSVAGRPADAKAVGDALKQREGVEYHVVEDDVELDYTLLTIMSHMEKWSRYHCIMFMEGTGATLPYGVWVFELTRADTHVQIRGISGGKTVSRTYKESMLKNSSFEMVPQIPGWHSNNHAISYLSSEEVRSGRYSMMIRDTRPDAGGQIISDPVSAAPGISYTASVYVCGTATSQLWLRFVNASGDLVGQSYTTFNPIDGMWRPITVTEQAPAGTAQAFIVLATTMATVGTTYFDDAQLQETGRAGNLLKNPSFETDVKIEGWSSNSQMNTLLTCEKVRFGNGRTALKLIDNTDAAGMQLISDPVSITPGVEYTASADFTGEGMCQIWLRYLDNYGTVVSQQYKTVIPYNHDWSHFEISALAPAKATKVCVILATVKSGTACSFVDNVFLAPKEEAGAYKSNVERFSAWEWSGQGNGGIVHAGVLESLEDLSELACSTLTSMAAPSTVTLSVICDFLPRSCSGSLTLYKAMGMDSIYQATAELTTTGADRIIGTTWDESLEGEWYPIQWEWDNPPMEEGVEYRTTERHMGEPVYTQLVYFGALPNATGKYHPHNIALRQVLRCNAYIVGGDCLPAVLNMNGYSATVYCNHTNIIIETAGDLSKDTAYVQVWYTKE